MYSNPFPGHPFWTRVPEHLKVLLYFKILPDKYIYIDTNDYFLVWLVNKLYIPQDIFPSNLMLLQIEYYATM